MKDASPDTSTLTLRDTPHALIQTAKRITGRATASQAILAGIGKLDQYGIWRRFLVITGRVPQDVTTVLGIFR